MFKNFLIIIFSAVFIISCSKTDRVDVDPSNEELAISVYAEAVEALKRGDAFYAGKKFKEVETLIPLGEWATKASLMSAYADYNRSAYSNAIFALERHINNYPADKNIPYAHYLIAMCYYEQILDEKKDLQPLLKAREKFNFILETFPDTDYAIDSKYKIDLIID